MSYFPFVLSCLMTIAVSFYARKLRKRLDAAEEFIDRVARIRARCREMNNSPFSREWAYDELLWLLDNSNAATERRVQCAKN